MNNISHVRGLLFLEGYGAVGLFLCSLLYLRTPDSYLAIPTFICALGYAYLWIGEYKKYKYLKKMQGFVDRHKPNKKYDTARNVEIHP